MITLFWCPQTRASRILWLLAAQPETFEVKMIDVRDPVARSDPDFVAASPMGKVPAIMDTTSNGVVQMADSASIGLYLADRYPAAGLAPAIDDPVVRDRLVEFIIPSTSSRRSSCSRAQLQMGEDRGPDTSQW